MEERRDLEGGGTQMLAPGWRCDVNLATWMQEYWNLDSDETGPAWSWDLCEFEMVAAWICNAILRTWMEVRRTSLILGAWVELRCNLWTWMEVICHQDGGEMEIQGRRLRWDATWMERRGESGLHGDETTWMRVRWDKDWDETHILRPEQVVTWLGWIWDSIIVTCMAVGYYPFFSVRHDLDRGETRMWWNWWNSYAALMKVRWGSMDLDGSLRWNMDGVGTLMEMSQDLCGCELHIFKPWCVWDGDWMDLWMNLFSGPGWKWDITWIDVRCKYMYIY